MLTSACVTVNRPAYLVALAKFGASTIPSEAEQAALLAENAQALDVCVACYEGPCVEPE